MVDLLSVDAAALRPRPGERVAAIGDVHGHFGDLLAALHSLGVEFPSGAAPVWPEDLWVVQTGDQVHKGPHSELVLSLRDELVAVSGGRFIDLFGNHEAQYVHGRHFFTEESGLRKALRSDVHRRVAVAAVFPDGSEVLFTHAGVTFDFWETHCQAAPSAVRVAHLLNRAWFRRDPVLKRAGVMLDGGAPDFAVSPLWSHGRLELVASWDAAGVLPPFDQVVGHMNFTDPREVPIPGSVCDFDAGHTFVFRADVSGRERRVFSFIDPGAGRLPARTGLVPLLLPA